MFQMWNCDAFGKRQGLHMSRVEDAEGTEVTEHSWVVVCSKTVNSVEVLECHRCGMVRTRDNDINDSCWFRVGDEMPKFGRPPNCSEIRMRGALR